MDAQEKLLVSKTEDLFSLCDKYAQPRFSGFLDGAEQAIIYDNVLFPCDYKVLFFGGFSDAEKKIMGVFPQWSEPDTTEFPISCLKVEGGYTRKLTHRDYLGTIMSLGLTSQKLGDIVVFDGYAYIFLYKDIAEYVKDNLHKIGNQGVTVTVIDNLNELQIERQYKTFGSFCASPRLDAVIAAAVNISRAQSATLINGGKIKVNHREVTHTAQTIKEGDLLSVRGHGRFIVHSFDGETRKGRIHITFKQYI